MSKPLLFIPGPVTCSDAVLAACGGPMVDHRGPAFKALLDRIARGMQPIFGTQGEVVVLGSSGTGGLEAAVASLFAPGERVLSCPIGVFGHRLRDIARTFGLHVDEFPTTWGSAVDAGALGAHLDAARTAYDGILLTHNETSTGTQNDMAALAAVLRGRGLKVVVDSVSGLGASRFEMDAWGFDVVVTASQKALAAPPGLAMVAVADEAWAKMPASRPGLYYLDLKKARDFAKLGQTPWTPPVSIAYALDAAIVAYAEEGAEHVWQRHERYARAIRAAAEALGLRLYSQPGAHSVTVVAIHAPEGIDGDAVRKTLREQRGVVMGGGQKELKGKLLRIGTMGDLSQTDVVGMLGALEVALVEHGYAVKMGAGVQAALGVFIDKAAAAV